MRVECAQCHQVYNIPDERLPKGKKIAFPCPACKETIKLDLRSNEEKAPPEAPGTVETDVALMEGGDLKKNILKSLKDLPPMPQVVLKAHQVMANPDSSFKDLGKVIETDQAIAARVLKLANSAYYGLRGMVSSIHQATIVLGYEALGELITVVGASGLLDSILRGYRLESGFLWQHSLAVAFGSRFIAQKQLPRLENDAFSAGLLHDAGKLVLDPYVMEKESEFYRYIEEDQKTFLVAEKEILGFDHAEIAYEMCLKWSIPESQGMAIKFHHYPSKSEKNQLAYILHVADTIAMKAGIGAGFDATMYDYEPGALEEIGLERESLEEISEQVVDSVNKIAEEMSHMG